jgi:hypothetical protein
MLLTHQKIIRNAFDSLGFGDIWNGHITTTDPVGKFTIYHMHMLKKILIMHLQVETYIVMSSTCVHKLSCFLLILYTHLHPTTFLFFIGGTRCHILFFIKTSYSRSTAFSNFYQLQHHQQNMVHH